ncbi:AAA family ATPase [Candidatus Acidianus copahuensis]|uniref:AAA family ATPase n=1 Tax=Candidatus Acidianus copahuensis TaxID=1160895 RepID=UPI00135F1B5C|nr:AAA family ATPase [Candidatus Acidianus copahuensis]
MWLKVKNLGPIEEFDGDIKDLTIVVGPNNSGKTFFSISFFLLTTLGAPFPYEGVKVHLKNGEVTINEDLTDVTSKILKALITSYFGIDEVKKLISWGEKESDIIFNNLSIKIYEDNTVKVEHPSEQKPKVKFKRVEGITSPMYNFVGDDVIETVSPTDEVDVELPLYVFYYDLVKEYFPSVYLPAERVTLATFTEPLLNYITNPLYLPPFVKPIIHNFLFVLAQEVNSQVLDNFSFSYNSKTKRVGYSYNGKRVPLVSTGTSQVAYIELSGGNEDIKSMVIEEPEINLHANAQVKMAKYLLSLLGKKRLFITTHSEIIPIIIAREATKRGLKEKVSIYEMRESNKGRYKNVKINIYDDGTTDVLKTTSEEVFNALEEYIS